MSQDDDATGKVLVVLVALPFLVLARAYVLSVLWVWFLAPLGVMEVGVMHAYGVSIIASLLTMNSSLATKEQSAAEAIFYSLFISGWFLGFGWVAHYVMGAA